MFKFNLSSAQPLGSWLNVSYQLPVIGYQYGDWTSSGNPTVPPHQVQPLLEIATIISGLQTYTLGIEGNLQEGEFFYDRTLGTITLNPPSLEPIVYKVKRQNLAFRNTRVCNLSVPQFLKDWNVDGSINISHSFQGHPSLSLSFEVYCNQEQQVKIQLCPGTEVFIWQRWRIQSVRITQSSNKDNLQVDLDLIGIHAPYGDPSRSLADKPIKLIEGKYKKYRTLADFAQKAGIQYRGANIKRRISRTTSGKDYTTVRQEIESRALTAKGFVYYDSSSAIEIRPWGGQATHLISETEVIGNISFSFNGVEPNKLAHELRNTILNLDFDDDEKSQNTGIVERWEFENADSLATVYSAAVLRNGTLFAPDPDVLRGINAVFDNGGTTKTARKFTEYNGVPLSVEEWSYGYAYTSLDVYRVLDLSDNKYEITFNRESPQNYWQEVKHSKTSYIYNEEGYLTKTITTGTELARLKQESEELEGINLRLQAIQVGIDTEEAQTLFNQAAAYTFIESLPINETTDYSLEALRDYYDDIQPPEESDVDWVEPRFSSRKNRVREDYLIKENPENTEELTLPPIILGKWQEESDRIFITNTGKPERFNRKTTTSNQEGENGKNAIALSTFSQNIGRPSIHTRLERNIDEPDNSGNYERYKNYKFWLSTPNSGSDYKFEENSKSFRDVDDPNEARAIAQTELSISNSRDTEVLNLTILWRDELEIGDAIVFRGIKYILFGMRKNLTVESGSFISPGIELTLGRYIQVGVNLRKSKNGEVILQSSFSSPTTNLKSSLLTNTQLLTNDQLLIN